MPEMGRVHRQQMGNVMRLHDSHKPRVMHLLSLHIIPVNQQAPLRVYRGRLRKKSKHRFHIARLLARLRGGKSQPVSLSEPGSDGLKLDQVLGGNVHHFPLTQQLVQGGFYYRMVWVGRHEEPPHDVGIEEIGHLKPAGIERFAVKCGFRQYG